MLSRDDNELMCRVGPGTPMGELLREYWIPAMLSSELEADGPVRRIRLLSEDLLAWRDSDGGVGVMEENCPHRGSSLIIGRNEEGGLRCVYHGWKFDVSGQCIDMPSEPPDSNFRHKVVLKAYATNERNGIIWIYMGPRQARPPELPDHEVNLLPIDGEPFKYVRECNWVQALEGDIDTVHINFLHTRINRREWGSGNPQNSEASRMHQADKNPRLEVVETEYGMQYGARRVTEDGRHYWRITQFVMPFYTMVTGPGGKVWIPIDDENTLVMEWAPARPKSMPREYDDSANMLTARQPWGYEPDDPMIPWGQWHLKANPRNYWRRDPSLENRLFLGIYSNPLQDSAVQVLMGKIYDRTHERLGTTDLAIIAVRRILLRAAIAYRDRGELPPTVEDPTLYRVRGTMCVLPPDRHWFAATADWVKAFAEPIPDEYAVPGQGGVVRLRAPS